jgi:chromosome condensin MukBEF ATPase and DNA-binding subunit MukB
MDKLQEHRADLKKSIRERLERIEQLSTDIQKITSHSDFEDAGRLEARRKQLEQEERAAIFRVNDLEREIQDATDAMNALDIRLSKLEKKDEQARLAERRLVAVQNVSAALKRIRSLRHENLQADLSERLSAIWDKIAIKD